jgi:hypothetical protein
VEEDGRASQSQGEGAQDVRERNPFEVLRVEEEDEVYRKQEGMDDEFAQEGAEFHGGEDT